MSAFLYSLVQKSMLGLACISAFYQSFFVMFHLLIWKDIRLSENPIADITKGGVSRFVLVARLAKVKILNGSEISARERRESEIRYVRLVMAMMQSVDPRVINLQHPRYAELKAHYEIDDEKASTGVAIPQKMSAGLISIKLICVGASMGERQPLVKKLPSTTTVGRLKILCESLFKLKGVKLRLFLQEKDSPLPTLLDDDTISLMNAGAGSEATVLVDEES
ncbi:tubulin-folding cofactor E-like [Phalaenopsis equestris]|uniref:tubulin-folding cofactor E-like n=1 Tax=Phalaenopsis equestris TaxID=78828 RepID=UPI0009E2DC7E|nr:tubulin-folding cofactor E-like [Phalaenopsis equestris]